MPFISLMTILDIFLTSIIIYGFYYYFRGTHTVTIVKGILLFIGLYIIANILQLQTILWLFNSFIVNFPLMLVVIFHQEFRRFFSNIGRNHSKTHNSLSFSQEFTETLKSLSEQQIGALILIEGSMLLNDILSNGVLLHARFSQVLLETIFYHGTPLHDGAVLIRDEKIIGAQIFIPSAFSENSPMGTRHSAAVAITEERDCVAFVVSEETGGISYAMNGVLTPISNVLIDKVVYEILK